MAEAVRLVIWDLDETFWRGTLTEGGIQEYVREHHDIVLELARRGIVSSICSKNDMGAVRAILEAEGLWGYFVLPSINWEPKGPRIAALVETMQLRAPTIMFIDDNPINLEEARHLVPGLQTQSHEFIPQILGSPLFKGKDDRLLTRLNQYKMLEKRQADVSAASGAIEDFLRKSNIRVRFDHNVLGNVNRAVELINRTNQLNFTKVRLPDDATAAAAALEKELSSHEVQAALVGVRDNYGDHGWCGIYILHTNGSLRQFAFSCRILGMHVETWLYRRLNSPRLAVEGEVLTDVKRQGDDIDWITVETDDGKTGNKSQSFTIDKIVARGGCDLMSVAHYFSMIAPNVIGEFNVNRFGLDARLDHSTFIATALEGQISEVPGALSRLGYKASDFSTSLLSDAAQREVWLLSFWTDAAYTLYRHRASGITVPFSLAGYLQSDARLGTVGNLPPGEGRDWLARALQVLQQEFDYVGFIAEGAYKQTLHKLFAKGAHCRFIFVVSANEYFISEDGIGRILQRPREQNAWLRSVAQSYDNVKVVNIRDFVRSETEVHDQFHFDRLVYFRLYEFIRDTINNLASPPAYKDWAIHLGPDAESRLQPGLSPHELSRTATFLLDENQAHLAKKFAERASLLEPGSLTHRVPLVEALIAMGARPSLQVTEVLNSPGISVDIMTSLGRRLLNAKLFDLAERMFDAAATAEPANVYHRHALANALERQGKKRETLAVLESCLHDGDVNPHCRAHVGRLLLSFGRRVELEQSLPGWMSDDPNFPPYEALKRMIEAQQKNAHVVGANF